MERYDRLRTSRVAEPKGLHQSLLDDLTNVLSRHNTSYIPQTKVKKSKIKKIPRKFHYFLMNFYVENFMIILSYFYFFINY